MNAYGGVYQITNNLLNGTGSTHTATVQSYRPGVGLQSSESYTARPGEWKVGGIAHVAIVPNDEFRYYLNGVLVAGIPANGIPFYMQHCKVSTSPSVKVRMALSYGLAALDSVYTGACAGTYRFGAAPSTAMWHYGASCNSGQGNYYQPAGVRGFDCSGLVYKMFQYAGVPFGWTSSTDMKNGIPQISKSYIQVGDLLVKYGHVAVYLGDGDGDGIASVLEATPEWTNPDGSKTGVIISNATSYLQDSAYTAHRVPGI
ncbi:MAG TPA: NlpC/P60 family protein [Archangium sp.]|uniref:NlpC/P60 family protein n=1 Tax=Archangium sp. TaxID=1872627 RepID=UPI002E35CA73|nr:NlpC/P60 family protein [Archangium sp.]HEX5751893.1 NlpC/P60 family protein [Archangium sp.]